MKLPLDVLINNAGSWPTDHIATVDGFQETFQVNICTHQLAHAIVYVAALAGQSSGAFCADQHASRRHAKDS